MIIDFKRVTHLVQQIIFHEALTNYRYVHTEISKDKHIWATSWENLFMPNVNNKDTDQPAHQRSLISAFVVHCLDSIISILAKSQKFLDPS